MEAGEGLVQTGNRYTSARHAMEDANRLNRCWLAIAIKSELRLGKS